MGQRIAKKDVEDGLRLYNERQFADAVRIWRRALRKLAGRRDRFTTLGYLSVAHSDWGRYRDMLAYAVQQIDLANEADNAAMRAEAYLNLARSNERLCEYHKAVSYCRRALQHPPKDPRVHGYVYLSQGQAYFGFSNFSKALESYEHAMKIAKQYQETALELQVYNGLGVLFTVLKDYEKALGFHLKAADLAKSFKICDINSKFQRITIYHMAHPYRKLGKLTEAMECCEDALKMSVAEADRPMQARCLCSFADIHRRRADIQLAYPRYEAAVNIMVEIGDRYGQIDVLAGMAKTMVLMKQLAKVCECKALEYNSKALDLAHSIGNKMHQLRCHLRMQELYRSLGDDVMVDEQNQHVRHLLTEMDLYCGVCSKPMGEKSDRLDALPCFHIVHTRCSAQLTRSASGRRGSRVINCPKCRKSVSRAASTGTSDSIPIDNHVPGSPSEGSTPATPSRFLERAQSSASYSSGHSMNLGTPLSAGPLAAGAAGVGPGGGSSPRVKSVTSVHGNPVYL